MTLAERTAIATTGQQGDRAQPLPVPKLTNDEVRRQLGHFLINPNRAECAR